MGEYASRGYTLSFILKSSLLPISLVIAPAIHDTQNQSGKKEGLPCHSEAGGLVKEAFVVELDGEESNAVGYVCLEARIVQRKSNVGFLAGVSKKEVENDFGEEVTVGDMSLSRDNKNCSL